MGVHIFAILAKDNSTKNIASKFYHTHMTRYIEKFGKPNRMRAGELKLLERELLLVVSNIKEETASNKLYQYPTCLTLNEKLCMILEKFLLHGQHVQLKKVFQERIRFMLKSEPPNQKWK